MSAGAAPPVRIAGAGRGLSLWQRRLVALAGTVAAVLLMFRADAAKMAAIWWESSTYEHCLAVPPLIGWLVWLRRHQLAAVRPRGWATPLAWVAAGSLGWLLGEAAGVAVARHLGLVMMLQGAVAALLGRAATRVLLFPLGYMLALVPAGDGLIPALQTVTARLCMALLALVRVPAALDGVFITTPAGWFKVAEACSGARFLIAMIALGVLVAHLGFRSWRRRAAFLAACVAVPVLANGVRAFATIWIAQRIGVEAAGGVDHVVWGWFFFAAVIALVLALSWRWFDRPADAPPADPDAIVRAAAAQRRALRLPVACAAVLAIAATGPAWAALMAARTAPAVPATLDIAPPPGWTDLASEAVVPWRPRFDGADRMIVRRFRDARGAEVEVAAAFFTSQGEGRELVGFGRGAVDPDGPWAWAAGEPAAAGWKGERIEGPGKRARIVWTSYRIGGTVTGSPARVKLAELRTRLIGGDPASGALLVSADAATGGRAAVARMAAALGDTSAALDRIAAAR